MLAFALLPLLALSAMAIKVTVPNNSTGWTSTGPQMIMWDSVSTDPGNFTIQLISPNTPNAPTTLAKEVNTADGSYTYTPTSYVAVGQQYRVNFISTSSQAGILAQSDYFEVKQGDATASSSSSSASSASMSGASQSASATLSQISASGSSAAAAASSSRAAGQLTAGVSGAGVVAAALLAFFA